MAAVTTERLLQLALELAGWSDAPADCIVASPGTRISHVLLGIEAGAAELFMARQLGYHAVIAHDPLGTNAMLSRYGSPHTRQRERERLTSNGVPGEAADALVAAHATHYALDALCANYDHAASVARLLDMPLVVVGSALDEVARRSLQDRVDALVVPKPDARVADLRDALMTIREYAAAQTVMHPALGGFEAPAGRTVVLGDASAPIDIDVARAYLAHGVDTVCCPALVAEDAVRLAKSGVRGTVLVLGRIATASIGLNAYAARLRAEGIEVTTLAGVVPG